MKKKIAASKAKKNKPVITEVHLTQTNDLSYLDKPTIAALHEIDVSVQYRGINIYLVKHIGVNHQRMLALPRKDKFNDIIKNVLGVDIAPIIIKHREKDCFTCGMMNGKCLDPKTCGQPEIVTDKNK